MRKFESICRTMSGRPADAAAWLRGSEAYPELEGCVLFWKYGTETIVMVSVSGLTEKESVCKNGFLGLHIHSGGRCSGNAEDPFADAGQHYNPKACEHPFHAGDLPPVLISGGNAFYTCLTSGFTPDEVRGRTVILHGMADDFRTQPSGDSGPKIACGRIL